MPTTLYFSTLNIAANSYKFIDIGKNTAGSSTTGSITTTSGGTWISLGFWASRAVEPFTFSGQASFNLWGDESNTQANASLGLRIYTFTAAGGLSSQIIQINASTEIPTSPTAMTANGTPASTNIGSNNILVFEVGAINIGTMGNGRTVNFYYNGLTGGAQGDSYVSLNENIIFRNKKKIFG